MSQLARRGMTIKKISDVESVLAYLQFAVAKAERGEKEEWAVGFPHALDVVAVAREALTSLGFADEVSESLDNAAVLVKEGRYTEADDLLLAAGRELRERSGSSSRLRELYATKKHQT
jgi:hypothetical protein